MVIFFLPFFSLEIIGRCIFPSHTLWTQCPAWYELARFLFNNKVIEISILRFLVYSLITFVMMLVISSVCGNRHYLNVFESKIQRAAMNSFEKGMKKILYV